MLTNDEICEQEGCQNPGKECRLYDYDQEKEFLFYYCVEHSHQNGFCPGCGEFWGGVERFDFTPIRLCENCEADLEPEDYSDDEPW